MTPPIQVLAPGVVLLTGPAVDAARMSVVIARRARSRNRLPDSEPLRILQEELERASAAGHSDITEPSEGETEVIETIGTDRVAQLLQCTPRHVRRRGTQLGGRMVGGRWRFDAQTVTEHIEGAT